MVTLEETVKEKIAKIQEDAELESRLQLAKELTADVQKKVWETVLVLHETMGLSFGQIARNIGFFWHCHKQSIHKLYQEAKLWEANGKK